MEKLLCCQNANISEIGIMTELYNYNHKKTYWEIK